MASFGWSTVMHQVDPDHNWHPWHPHLRVLTSHGLNPLHQIQDILSSTNPTTSTEYMVRPFFGGNKCQIFSPWTNEASPDFSVMTVISYSNVFWGQIIPPNTVCQLCHRRFTQPQKSISAAPFYLDNVREKASCPISKPNLPSRTSLLRGTYYFDLSCFHPVKSRIVTIGPTWIVVPHLQSALFPLRFISYINNSGQVTIIPKPELRGFFGVTKPRFGVTSAEVAMFEWVAQHGFLG